MAGTFLGHELSFTFQANHTDYSISPNLSKLMWFLARNMLDRAPGGIVSVFSSRDCSYCHRLTTQRKTWEKYDMLESRKTQ